MSGIPQWTDKMTPYQRCEFGMALATMNRLIDNATEYRCTYNITVPAKSMELAAAQGDDTDVIAYYAEAPLVAANVFHLRGGRVVDRREFYWEDLESLLLVEGMVRLLGGDPNIDTTKNNA
jgi:excinuclease UvrABC nuclease subunit